MTTFRILVAAGAGGLLLAAVACSSNSTTSAAQPAKTSTLAPSQAVELAASQPETSLTATFHVSTQGSTASNSVGTVQEQTKPSLFLNLDMSSLTVNGQTVPGGVAEILTPSTLYLRLHELSQMTGKQWLKLPFSQLNGLTGGLNVRQLIQQASTSDPTTQTQFLAGASNVHKAGTGVIDGVPVTEYTGTVSMTKALQRIPAAERPKISQAITKAGLKSANFTVWLDAQHHVRKLTMTDKGNSVTETTTMLVTGIDQPVNAQLPPASQTATVPVSDLRS